MAGHSASVAPALSQTLITLRASTIRGMRGWTPCHNGLCAVPNPDNPACKHYSENARLYPLPQWRSARLSPSPPSGAQHAAPPSNWADRPRRRCWPAAPDTPSASAPSAPQRTRRAAAPPTTDGSASSSFPRASTGTAAKPRGPKRVIRQPQLEKNRVHLHELGARTTAALVEWARTARPLDQVYRLRNSSETA